MTSHAPDIDRPPVDFALYLAAQGFRILPIPPRRKGPVLNDWPNKATTDPGQIAQWFDKQPDGNYGIATAGLIVVDIDPRHGGHLWLEENEHRLPDTLRFRTCSGGFHFLFRAPDGREIGNPIGIAPGIDIRGNGGQIVGPGSIHPDGGQYTIEVGPNDVELAETPAWLIELIEQPKPKPNRQDGPEADLNSGPIPEGTRDATLTRICGHLFKALSEPKVREELRRINAARCQPPLPQTDVERIVKSISGREEKQRGAKIEAHTNSATTAISAAPLGNLDPHHIPQRRWLLGRRLNRGYITLTIAPGGAGKSTLTVQESVALATGTELTGAEVHESGPVWVWNNEDPLDEMHRRVAAICLRWGIKLHDLAERLFINSGFDRRLVIAEERDGVAVATPDVGELIAEIQRHGITCLVIDPLIRAHRLRENDNEALDFAVEQFGKIANTTNCAIHLVHHSRKPPGASTEGQAGNPDSSRGASALVYAARVVDTLYGISEKDGQHYGISEEDRRLYVRLDSAKANLFEPRERTVWLKRESATLPNGPDGTDGDSVGVLVPVDLADAEEQAKREQEAPREYLAGRVAELLDDDEARSVNDLATHLINSGRFFGSARTVGRKIREAIPNAPASRPVDLDGEIVKVWRFKEGQGKTSRILVRRASNG